MKLLVTGGSGYVGAEILRRAPRDWQVAATYLNHPIQNENVAAFRVDMRAEVAINALFARCQPNVAIHTAALMAGDAMMATNVDGARHIARAARHCNARFIHLSSDVIFDGEHAPYDEDALPQPVHAYGESKARAEVVVREVYSGVIASRRRRVQAISEPRLGRVRGFVAHLPLRAVQGKPAPRNDTSNLVIVRTSLVYGFNPLDPRTAQTLNGEIPRLFTDEFRCPIFVADLADALLELARNDFTGILHIAGPQKISRYEFGLMLARAYNIAPKFSPALSASHPAPRPRDCALNIARAQRVLKTKPRGVDQVIAELFPPRS